MTGRDLAGGLRDIGYSLHLEEDNIRFRYGREGQPPREAASLLSEVKRHKEAIIDFLNEEPFRLIEMTLIEINEFWESGTLEWCKKFHREAFERMVSIEEEINRKATAGNTEGIKEASSQYKNQVSSMVAEFKKGEATTETPFG